MYVCICNKPWPCKYEYFKDIRDFKSVLNIIALKQIGIRVPIIVTALCLYPAFSGQDSTMLFKLSFRNNGVYPPRGVDYTMLLTEHDTDALTYRRERHGADFT